MKMKSLLGIVLSLSILQSCQNDETNIIQNEVNNKGITFSSIIAYSGGYPFSISGDIRSVPS